MLDLPGNEKLFMQQYVFTPNWGLQQFSVLDCTACSIQGADKVLGQNIILNLITLKHVH